MASFVEQLAAAARAAVARLMSKTKLRMGLTKTPQGDKRLYVGTVNADLTLPGLYESAAREAGLAPRVGALEELRKVTAGYVNAQEEAAKAAVTRVVTHLVKQTEGRLTKEVKKDLVDALDHVLDKVGVAVERIANTEATAARNLAGVEAIAAMGTSAGEDDPTVYFVVVRDDKTCKECLRLHTVDGGSPKVWKLSEVSRTYHRTGEDRPSVLGIHPRCFVGSVRLSTDRGLLTVKELFETGGELQVAVDLRVTNRRTIGNQFGKDIPGKTWFDRHKSGSKMLLATAVFDTGIKPCVRVMLENGISVEVSEEHEFWVDDDKSGLKVEANKLQVGQKIPLLSGVGGFGKDHFPDLAELMGNLLGDGAIGDLTASWHFFGDDIEYGGTLLELARPYCGPQLNKELRVFPPDDKYSVPRAVFNSMRLSSVFKEEFSLSKTPRRVPPRLWGADTQTVCAFLRGLYAADGHSEGGDGGVRVVLAQNDLQFLQEIQQLLGNLSLRTSVYTHGELKNKIITYADGSNFDTIRQPCWRLHLGGWDQVAVFCKMVGMGVPRKQKQLLERLATTEGSVRLGAWRTTHVVSVEPIGNQQTYCLTEPMSNTVTANGLVVGQCRCTMVYLAKGFGFKGNSVSFIKLGHDAYEAQSE